MKKKLKFLSVVAPIVFALDQLTKWLIVEGLPPGSSIPVISGFFDIVHTRNRGAAFGLFSHLSDSVRVPFFMIVSCLSVVLIVVFYLKMKEERFPHLLSFPLILGGALGNIWDRLFLGEVIDFLSFHWRDAVMTISFAGSELRVLMEWPAFNVADSAITVAVAWLIVTMMRQ